MKSEFGTPENWIQEINGKEIDNRRKSENKFVS